MKKSKKGQENLNNRLKESVGINGDRPARQGSNKWPLSIAAIVLFVILGVVSIKFITTSEDTIAGALSVEVIENRVVVNAIGDLTKENKLVILSADVMVEEDLTSEKRILWGLVDLGTTAVEIRVYGNRVQYIIPTLDISVDNVNWNESTRELVVNIPKPILDESIVEVQSDPDQIEVRRDIGWARLSSRSGNALEEQLRRDLRSAVVEAGNHELIYERACSAAKTAVYDIFQHYIEEENLDINLRISIIGAGRS